MNYIRLIGGALLGNKAFSILLIAALASSWGWGWKTNNQVLRLQEGIESRDLLIREQREEMQKYKLELQESVIDQQKRLREAEKAVERVKDESDRRIRDILESRSEASTGTQEEQCEAAEDLINKMLGL